ncbi:MAG: penicillin-binding protein 1C [Alcanivoracaceae bacterium]|nr:penicillin-binding protein 1C [Alcanivoracaceae bacterium]
MLKLKKWLKRLTLITLALFISFIMLDFLMPLPIEDFNKRHFAQVVVDKDGLPLRSFPDSQGVWRYPVELSEVSPLYLQALLNYEDRYYYQHFGVNPLAIMRAFGQWLTTGELVSGASTLTMQVARILIPHKKSFSGKIAQMFRALQLEWHYNKQEILTYYINYAPFGGPLEGVQAASYAYLDKSVTELSHSEAALLAVMPQSPSRFRPDRYPQRAQKARNKLLTRLLDFEIWSAVLIKEAMDEPVFAQYNTRPQIAPLLSRRLIKKHPHKQVIKSTIDSELQIELEALVKDYMANKPAKMSAALLLVDNQDLTTLAYIGSADFLSKSRAGHVDMIQAVRSPGSTLKPFIYGIAIDEGIIHAESLLFDVPQSFASYRPKNFTESFSGPVSASQALGRSLNMPAVQVLHEITPESFYAKLKNAGLDIKLPLTAKPNLSLALGGGGVSMQQLLGVFSSLGRKGMAGNIRSNMDEAQHQQKLLSKGSAWIVQNILSQVPLKGQLHSQALLPQQTIAYKTGTSYGYRDAWVLASNQKYSIAIWLGQPDGSFLEKNTGRSSAVPLLRKVLSILPNDWTQPVKQPFNVAMATICWPLGTKQNVQESQFCHKKRNAYLLEETAPPTINDALSTAFSGGLLTVTTEVKTGLRVLPSCSPGKTTAKQFAVWPRVLEPWLAIPFRRESILPNYSKQCQLLQSSSQLRIVGIHDNAIIYPEASSQQLPHVQLKLEGSVGDNYWFVNGILQESTANKLILIDLQTGQYKVHVVDDSGNFTEIKFEVKI